MKHYDVLVIGTGAANIVTDAAVAAGKSVALVERHHLGGTCLNHGCIPTKVLCTVADIIVQSRRYRDLGIQSEPLTADWDEVRERVFATTEGSRGDLDQRYETMEGLDLYRGTARFTGEKEIEVRDDAGEILVQLRAETIILATGGRTMVPPIEGADQIDYLSSERFFERATYPQKPPRSLAIVGGGPIAVEFAHIFDAFGTEVTIIQRSGRLLRKSDADVAAAVEEAFAARGIEVRFNTQTESIEKTEDGLKLHLKQRETGEKSFLDVEQILFATGIESTTDLLDPEKTGLIMDERGWIPTNEYLETNVPGIYALGDLNGLMQLRHKANYEAEVLWHNLYVARSPEEMRACDYRFVPYVTFTSPQTAQVGMTEDQVREAGIPYEVSKMPYGATAKGGALGFGMEDPAFSKVLLHKETGEILGVHIVGEEASILIQGYVYLMQAGAGRPPVRDQGWASEDVLAARQAPYEAPPANNLRAVTESMTAHPSLGEVTAWAFTWNRWDNGIGTP